MKLVYAVDKISYSGNDHIGVVKKVKSQIAQFEKAGIEVKLCQYVWQAGYPQIEIEKDTDILYFRRTDFSMKLILKLKQLKKINPDLRVIMEIPTYPFEAESNSKTLLRKKINRFLAIKLMRFYVNRIVVMGQQYPLEKLYHISTICINNGVDFQDILIKNVNDTDDSEHEIPYDMRVGLFFWHGYDRLIEGMHQYYEQITNYDQVFHIVGKGDCLEEYRKMASQYGLLDNKIFFYGSKVESELDAIYNRCDIAIDCLGCHRKNIYYVSSLKSKEYGAKGLPMISSVQLDIYNEGTAKYIKVFPANDEAIDVKEIVDFYNKLYLNRKQQEVAEEIREKFYPICDWKFVFRPVMDYINSK